MEKSLSIGPANISSFPSVKEGGLDFLHTGFQESNIWSKNIVALMVCILWFLEFSCPKCFKVAQSETPCNSRILEVGKENKPKDWAKGSILSCIRSWAPSITVLRWEVWIELFLDNGIRSIFFSALARVEFPGLFSFRINRHLGWLPLSTMYPNGTHLRQHKEAKRACH